MSERLPSGLRLATRAPGPRRPYNQRSGADVRMLLILALVSLILGLGLSTHRRAQKDTVPVINERNCELEKKAELPGREQQAPCVRAKE